ncbi:hypothetical protein ACKFKG_19735 [Phormidesmis sp. 146-35]
MLHERLLVLVIGSSEGTIETSHNLYARGFAEVSAWSPLLPAPHPREVVSILSLAAESTPSILSIARTIVTSLKSSAGWLTRS